MSTSPIVPRSNITTPPSSSTVTTPNRRYSSDADLRTQAARLAALTPQPEVSSPSTSLSAPSFPGASQLHGHAEQQTTEADRKFSLASLDKFERLSQVNPNLTEAERLEAKPILYLTVNKGRVTVDCAPGNLLRAAKTPGKKEVFHSMSSGKLDDGSVLIADPVVVNRFIRTLNLSRDEYTKLKPFVFEHGSKILEADKKEYLENPGPSTSSQTPITSGLLRFQSELKTSKAWLDGSIVSFPEWHQMEPSVRQEKLADAMIQRPVENSEVIRGLCGVPKDKGEAINHDSIDFAGALKIPLKDGNIAIVQYAYDGTGHAEKRGRREKDGLVIKEMEQKIVRELSLMTTQQLSGPVVHKIFKNADSKTPEEGTVEMDKERPFGAGMFALTVGERTFFSPCSDGAFFVYRPGEMPTVIYNPVADSTTTVMHTPPGTEIFTVTDGIWNAPTDVAKEHILDSLRKNAAPDENIKLEQFTTALIDKESNNQKSKAYSTAKTCIGMIKGNAPEEVFEEDAKQIDINSKIPGLGSAVHECARNAIAENPEISPNDLAEKLLVVYREKGLFSQPTIEDTAPKVEAALLTSALQQIFDEPGIKALSDSINTIQENIQSRKTNLYKESNDARARLDARNSKVGLSRLLGSFRRRGAEEAENQKRELQTLQKNTDELQGAPNTPLADLNNELLVIKQKLKDAVNEFIPHLKLGPTIDLAKKQSETFGATDGAPEKMLVEEIIGTIGLEKMFERGKPASFNDLIEKSLEVISSNEFNDVDDVSGVKYTVPAPSSSPVASSSQM